MKNRIPGWQRGQAMVEYAIILILVSVVVVVVLITQGNAIKLLYSDIVCGFGNCPTQQHED